MNKKIRIALEYLRTIALTLLVAFFILVIMLVFAQNKVYQNQTEIGIQDETIEYYLVGVLIDKNKYLEAQYPKNYKINMKLGMLYEIYRDYKNAEINYKTAIIKAPFDDYTPQYKLANLYIRMNKFEEAKQVMDDIDERPLSSLIDYKGDIYNQIGDKLYNSSDYKDAVTMYIKALSYFEITKSPKVKDVRSSLASAYLYDAEKSVSNMKIDDAIESLTLANKLVDAPIIKYKLALLLMPGDPALSYRYFLEVFEKEPSIINYDVYFKFLNHLADLEDAKGNFPQANLYRYKAAKFKEYYNDNILSVDDIKMAYSDSEMTFSKWKKKYNINLELKLKNASSENLKTLFVHVIFKEGDITFAEYSTQIVDKKHPLSSGQLSPIFYIRTYKNQKLNEKPIKQLSAEVYVSKLENSYKIYLKTIDIKLVSKHKKHHWIKVIKEFFQRSSHPRPKLKRYE